MSAAALRLVVDPLDVRIRLRELGLEHSELTRALLSGASALALCCTTNHPPAFGGIAFWAESVKSLRDTKMAQGWQRSDARNYSTVVNRELGLQVAVARGDEWTGRTGAPDGKPSTLHKKGAATQQAVEVNHQQLMLFDRLPESQPDGMETPITTWVLLHFRDRSKIRCELSHPTAINKSGFVEAWHERIILAEIDLEASRISLPDDEPVEPEIQIKRRG